MASLDDLVKALNLDDSSGVQIAGGILGTLSEISGVISLVQFGLSLVGVSLTQDKGLATVLSAIQQDFVQLEGQISAEDKLARMRDVDQAMQDAVAVFYNLPAILSSPTPPTQDFILTEIQTCLAAVLFFVDNDDKWQAVWQDLRPTYYSDDWSGLLAPQSGSDGLVFNYTYTLPQFLRATYILLIVIGALDPSLLNSYQAALSNCATRLKSVHDTIVSGIVGTRLPTAGEVGEIIWRTSGSDPHKKIPEWDSAWSTSDPPWSYGAVEIYSSTSNVGSYHSLDWNNLSYEIATNSGTATVAWSPQDIDNFLKLVQLRILRQKKALYRQLGMPVVWQVINQLRQLTGQPLLTGLPYEAWSVKEVFSTLSLPLPADFSGVEPALATFLQGTPSYTSFTVFSPHPKDPNYPKDPASYMAQVPALPLPRMSLFDFVTGTYVPHGGTSNGLSGYVWPDGSSQYVFYVGTGGDVHALLWRAEAPSWQDGNLTARNRAPSASTDSALSSYVWPDGSSQHVFYVGTDGRMYELVWEPSGFVRIPGWHPGGSDLQTAQDGLPQARATALSSYVWPDGSSQHVFFVGTDGHLYEFVWEPTSGWHPGGSDLQTAQAGAPSASTDSALSSYVWHDGSQQHVFYVGTDGRVYELVRGLTSSSPPTSGWHPGGSDLQTAQDGLPQARATALSSYVWPDGSSQHVFFVGTDGHVYKLVWEPTSGWQLD